MKKITRRSFLKATAACGVATGLAACGADTSSTATSTATSTSASASTDASGAEAPVELIWYTRFDDQDDTTMVNEKLNELTLAAINATVKIINIPMATYNDKMQVILGGREACDIVFTGTYFADFWGNAANGAFLPLNDLIEKYGKETYEAIPEAFWDGVRLNGEIYGIINYQIEAKQIAYMFPTDIVDAIDFDFTGVEDYREMEPFLAKVKDAYPERSAVYCNWIDMVPMMGFDEIGTSGSPGAVLFDDDTLTVVNQYTSEGFREFVNVQREWNKAGYFISDVATNENATELMSAGKIGGRFANTKPGGVQQEEMVWGCPLTENVVFNGRVISSAVSSTLNSISSTSKNPEKAMQFINLLNTDKEIYNLVCWGIEDVHYTKTGENNIEFIENSGYAPNKAWGFGNTFNSYLYGGQTEEVFTDTIALNESSDVSPLLGFVFDMDPVSSQMAQCQSVYDQYYKAITTGSVDPEKYIPEFVAKLEAAGCNDIIAEKQAQLDAWKATR